ncbi:MAG TPA: hypothetical protein PK096_04495 [Candidatus Saccharibacteria bacterium]|nr:hypothetical protein [Candidatus Saccharibacteria bacterium]HRK94597.1 hypothetical protein [Candidatus Saccharibacteria bacterium]
MSTKELTHKLDKPSKLQQFNLGFEFNETWEEARKKYTASKK